MADNNAHPGVRSLLAKFETSQSPLTSPQSRGRSPGGSDTDSGRGGSRSRIRTNFVNVDEPLGSTPGSPLRNGRSGSPAIFGPQINAEEVKSRRQNVGSPTPAGHVGLDSVLDQPAKGSAESNSDVPEQTHKEEAPSPKEAPAAPTAPVKKAEPSPSASAPTPAPAPAPAQSKPTDKLAPKMLSKRPSNIGTSKPHASTKPSSTTPTATGHKSPTPTTGTKPPSAREAAKERSNAALAHKQSRTSLNSAPKTTTSRMARGATPSQETSRRSPPQDSNAKTGTKSATKPARLPASMTAPTQASAAKLGTAGSSTGPTTGSTARTSTTGATLTRKPSSLKSAAGAPQARATASATGVRRQPSRPSLPTQSAHERPSSRTSDVGSKPVNEGFLARMMRPTASSASKTHEKPDTKTSTKTSAPAKAPRQSIGRPAERNTAPAKPKAAPLRPQAENSQAPKKETASSKEMKTAPKEQNVEKENLEEAPPVTPEVASPVVPEESPAQDAIAEQPELETHATATDDTEKETEQGIPEVSTEPAATKTQSESPNTQDTPHAEVESHTESAPEASAQADGPVDAGDSLVGTKEDIPSEDSVAAEAKDSEETTTPVVQETGNQEALPEVPAEPASKVTQDAVQEPTIQEAAVDEATAEPVGKDGTEDATEEATVEAPTETEQKVSVIEQEPVAATTSDVPAAEAGVGDELKSAEANAPESHVVMDKNTVDPVPVAQTSTENRPTADEIDFNSLALT
ncbi:hypothetical protein N7492_004557 [Penicillium capsulatum]|uniref:Mucin-7 n=1 Tax=Penicillium capsulatum TaxID=69766 RepID=A0A9W9IA45_9EURO|nr:hypothetical protein N7492_004557 [Penicillium capsulatum]KAJ6136325.1 hypothetical protein N7512_001485 [Penicillium capsulatum]